MIASSGVRTRFNIRSFSYLIHDLTLRADCLLRVNRVDLAASAVCPVIGPLQTWRFAPEGVGPRVIQVPKREPRIMRYELSDYEWTIIKPMLPNKPRGVARVNDRRVLNGIFWVLRQGALGVICR